MKGNERMWVDVRDPDPDERYVGKVAYPVKVMVWGAISYYGRSLLYFHDTSKGKIDSEAYCKCIEEAFLSSLEDEDGWPHGYLGIYDGYVFQQDGAKSHTSAFTDAWLDDHLDGNDYLPKGAWPANSPDLNIIETV